MPDIEMIKERVQEDISKSLQSYLGLPVSSNLFETIRRHILQVVFDRGFRGPVRHSPDNIKLKIASNPKNQAWIQITPLNMYTGLILNDQWDQTFEFVEAHTLVEEEDELFRIQSYKNDRGLWQLKECKDTGDFEFFFIPERFFDEA
jgi:hypothetical protein